MVKQIILGHLSTLDAVDQPSITEIAKAIDRPIWRVRAELAELLQSGDVIKTRLGHRLSE